MLAINVEDFPNFFLPRKDNMDITWEEEFWAVEIKSAREVHGERLVFSLSEQDYTLFVLRFA